MIKSSPSRIVFNIWNTLFLIFVTALSLFPVMHTLAISLSDSTATAAGLVSFWPIKPTLEAYEFLMKKEDFFRSVWISIQRVVIGSTLNMLIISLTSYPLSRSSKQFRSRNFYMVYFALTMFLGAGLIPTYMIIKNLGLLNSFWVLVLPGAVNVWNIIIMMNFIRGLPRAVEEAAFIDGASHWQTLFHVVLPMSLPSLASLLLFTLVGHWNAWFDGIFYMNSPANYPMATYLATQILNNNRNITNMTPEMLATLVQLNERTMRAAQLFISILPILVVYPYLQRFFIKGIVVGSVKE